MNVKSKIATFAAASIFALSLGTTGALATDSQSTVEQKIVANTGAGTLTASLDGASSMTPFTFSLYQGKTDGNLIVNVTDARGVNDGWNVTLTSGSFNPINGTNGTAIPAKGLLVKDGGALTAVAGSADGVQPGQAGVSLESGQSVLRANKGKGTGIYKKDVNVELTIPASQSIGTYQADVTVSIAAAPGQ